MLAGIGAYVALSAPLGPALAVAAALAAALGLLGIALGQMELTHWAIGLMAACYVVSLFFRTESLDPWAPLVAAGLLASSELAGWAIDSRRRGRDDLAVHLERLRSVALEIAAALALVVVVQASWTFGGGGALAVGLAAVSVVFATGVICLLIWRTRPAG